MDNAFVLRYDLYFCGFFKFLATHTREEAFSYVEFRITIDNEKKSEEEITCMRQTEVERA